MLKQIATLVAVTVAANVALDQLHKRGVLKRKLSIVFF